MFSEYTCYEVLHWKLTVSGNGTDAWLNYIHNPLYVIPKSTTLKSFSAWCTFIRWQNLTWTDVLLLIALFTSPSVKHNMPHYRNTNMFIMMDAVLDPNDGAK